MQIGITRAVIKNAENIISGNSRLEAASTIHPTSCKNFLPTSDVSLAREK